MKHFWIVAVSLFATACASYKIERVAPVDDQGWSEGETEGYLFYAPEPYLRVVSTPASADGKVAAKVEAAIVWLPNRRRTYRVTTSNFLAKADLQFAFEEGWMMTSIVDKGDNTTVVDSLLGAVGEIAPLTGAEPSVALYRFEFGEDGVVSGLVRVAITQS